MWRLALRWMWRSARTGGCWLRLNPARRRVVGCCLRLGSMQAVRPQRRSVRSGVQPVVCGSHLDIKTRTHRRPCLPITGRPVMSVGADPSRGNSQSGARRGPLRSHHLAPAPDPQSPLRQSLGAVHGGERGVEPPGEVRETVLSSALSRAAARMSACSRDRNTGNSAGAQLRITRSSLRFNRSVKHRSRFEGSSCYARFAAYCELTRALPDAYHPGWLPGMEWLRSASFGSPIRRISSRIAGLR